MSLLSNLPLDFRARIRKVDNAKDWIEFDASLSENHSYKNEISRIPLENGSLRTDHINTQPFEIEMKIRLSDVAFSKLNPFSSAISLINLGTDAFLKSRSAKTFLKLVEWRNEKASVYLVTGLNVFTSLEIEEITAIRDESRGNGENIMLKLVEIQEFYSEPGKQKTNVVKEVKHTFGVGDGYSLGLLSS